MGIGFEVVKDSILKLFILEVKVMRKGKDKESGEIEEYLNCAERREEGGWGRTRGRYDIIFAKTYVKSPNPWCYTPVATDVNANGPTPALYARPTPTFVSFAPVPCRWGLRNDDLCTSRKHQCSFLCTATYEYVPELKSRLVFLRVASLCILLCKLGLNHGGGFSGDLQWQMSTIPWLLPCIHVASI